MYKIIGADGKEYGPITAETLRQWIAQGRANAQTRVLAEGATEWKWLGALPEFANAFVAQVPPAIMTSTPARRTNAFATTGLILGALSWVICCCYGFPCNLFGIIFSVVALSQISSRPEVYEGRGLAWAGLILSIASILFYAALLLISIATGNFHVHWNINHFTQP